MLILPAIDLLGGKAVRLYKGDYGAVTSYADDPVELALSLEASGVKRLHLVDLDAAKGNGNNRAIIAKIRAAVSCELELGGGIRSDADVDELIQIGVNWLIIGTAIVKSPDIVQNWIKRYPGRFIAGIDAYDGVVKIAGWIDDTPISDIDLGRTISQMGFSAIIYTNISRDGTLSGPDFDRTIAMAQTSGLRVILSGGIADAADIDRCAQIESQGILGFISGKALYEGRINLADIVRRYPQGV